MGWGGREDEEKTCALEALVYFQRQETHSHREHDG